MRTLEALLKERDHKILVFGLFSHFKALKSLESHIAEQRGLLEKERQLTQGLRAESQRLAAEGAEGRREKDGLKREGQGGGPGKKEQGSPYSQPLAKKKSAENVIDPRELEPGLEEARANALRAGVSVPQLRNAIPLFSAFHSFSLKIALQRHAGRQGGRAFDGDRLSGELPRTVPPPRGLRSYRRPFRAHRFRSRGRRTAGSWRGS